MRNPLAPATLSCHPAWRTQTQLPGPWAFALLIVAACLSCRNEPAGPSASAGQPQASPAIIQSASNGAPDASVGTRPADEDTLGGCAICHVDVADKVARGKHRSTRIGCVACHGPSEAHVADENNQVKPDRTFARGDIDPFCADCHKCTRVSSATPASRPPTLPPVCIDCHPAH